MSTIDRATRRTRRNQVVLFSALAAAVLVVFAVWIGAGGDKPPARLSGIDAELAGDGTAEASWVRRSEARIGGIETRLREMEARNGRLETENTRLQTQLRENAADARSVIDRQAALIEELGRRLDVGQQANPAGGPPGAAAPGNYFGAAGRPASGQTPNRRAGEPLLPARPMIIEFELEVGEEAAANEAMKPLGAYLPAGSHAEAIVIAGVDGSAGVRSQGDPRPVLLRLTGPAHSAAEDGAARTVDIEGCTVTGVAYGDLSSEKVYVRVRTLTCAGAEPDTVIETQVAGFVAGTGKAGVRGPVVSREGDLVEKAFLAGLVSGLGEGISQAFQPQAVATGGASAAVANTALADIGRAGLGAGAASAGQKVADYLIKRAEQYQPVIQLQAGTAVTVVFLEGAWLDGRKEKGNG